MKTRSLLVSIPGNPLAIESLLPQRILASSAGALHQAGHETTIWDFGTLDMLPYWIPSELHPRLQKVIRYFTRQEAAAPLEEFRTVVQLRNANRLFRKRLEWTCLRLAEHMGEQNPDFIAFLVKDIFDWIPTEKVISFLHSTFPEIRIGIFGPGCRDLSSELFDMSSCIDMVVMTASPESALPAWAEILDMSSSWDTLPAGCAYRRDGIWLHSNGESTIPDFIPIQYDPKFYPACMLQGGKIRLFEAGRETSGQWNPLTDKTWKETLAIHHHLGSLAFRFNGHPPLLPLRTSGASFVFYHEENIATADMEKLCLLRECGCEVLVLRVPTGSQRLLDDFYHQPVTVTQVEERISICKELGFYTMLRFTFPCPLDDFHTHAETIRLVKRTQPDAALVSLLSEDTPSRNRGPLRFPFGRWPHASRPIGELSPVQVVQAHEKLIKDFEELGIAVTPSPLTALMARVTGSEPEQFTRRFVTGLYGGEMADVLELVDTFNREVTGAPAIPGKLANVVGN